MLKVGLPSVETLRNSVPVEGVASKLAYMPVSLEESALCEVRCVPSPRATALRDDLISSMVECGVCCVATGMLVQLNKV